MIRHLKAGFLAHGLHLADDLPHKALFNECRGQYGVDRHGDIPVGYGIEALPLGRFDQQIIGGQLHRPLTKVKAQLAFAVQNRLGSTAVQVRQRLADLTQLLAVLGANSLQLRLKVVADEALHLFGEDDLFDVQLLPDDIHIEAVQVLIGLHIHLGQRLAVLAVGAVAGGASQLHNPDDLIHLALQLFVDPLLLHGGEVTQMDALGGGLIDAPHQVLVNLLGKERYHRGGGLGDGHQRRIQRHVGGHLIGLHAGGPVALTAAAHIPVAHLVHKALQRLRRLGDTIVRQVVIHRLYGAVKAAQQPAIHYRQVIGVQRMLCRVKAVDIRIQHKEGIGIPQGAYELPLTLHHRLAVEAVGQPRGGVDIEIPADRVGAVGLQRLKGVDGVALGFTHLLAIFILHMPQHNDILKAGPVEHQGGNGVQRIEPAAGLIHCLADEVGGELRLKQLLILKGIVVLRKGHGTGIEPAVDDLRHTVHLLAALGAADGHGVNEGTVQLDVLGAVVAHLLQFLNGTNGMALAAFALPDVEGGAPITVAAQTPVLDILQPVAKAALANALRDPVDGIIVADEVILHCRHLDEPALAGIVQQGGIAAPAEGIIMLKLGGIVQQTPPLQVHQHLGVGVLHKQPRKGRFLGHMALAIHKLHKGQVIAAAYLGVVLTKGRRDVNDAGTVAHGNIVGAGHIKALFLLLLGALGSAGEKRLIFLIFQCGAGHLLQHLIGWGVLGLQPSQYGIQQRLRHVVGVAVGGLHLAVGVLGIHTQRHITG